MLIARPGDRIDKCIAQCSVFLAGPTPRDEYGVDWRPEAIEIFEAFDFDGTLFVPAPFLTTYKDHWENYYFQIDWENRALQAATIIMFWVPRDLKTMPAFTTNVEFGMYVKSGKMVYGRPVINRITPPKTGYLDWHAQKNNVPILDTLRDTVATSITLLN